MDSPIYPSPEPRSLANKTPPSPEPAAPTFKLSPAKAVSRFGWACVLALVLSVLLQMAAGVVIGIMAAVMSKGSEQEMMVIVENMLSHWSLSALASVFMYIVAFPVAALLLRSLPKRPPAPPSSSFTGKSAAIMVTLMFGVGYLGSYIGTYLPVFIASLIGKEPQNPLMVALDGMPWYTRILVVVIGAGVFEELFFRKLAIDRLRAYGNPIAISASALAFGLFHGNLYQFFYAFAMGLLMGFLYCKTGKILYCMILHCLFNLVGSVIVPNIFAPLLEDSDAAIFQSALTAGEPLAIAYLAFSLFVWILIAAAAILAVRHRKSFGEVFAQDRLAGVSTAKSVLLNVGMIVLLILCFISFMMLV